MVHERCTTNYRSLQVVGTFAGRIDGKPLTLRPTPQRILALLSVTGELSRQDAARLLWPDVHQARALANLRNALWRLRDDGPGFVSEDSGILRLQDVAVDLHEHRRWMRSALTNNLPFQPVLSNGSYEILPGWDEDWLIQPREEFTLLSLYAFEAAGPSCSLGAGHRSAPRDREPTADRGASARRQPLRRSSAAAQVRESAQPGIGNQAKQ
jgi:hypothetical protein